MPEAAGRPEPPELRLQRALDRAFRLLARRDHTVAEVRRNLERARVEPPVIDEVLEELGRQGYLDDARFAKRFAEDRRTLDGWGADRIAARLRHAGVREEHVERAVGARGAEDERHAAEEILARRFPGPLTDDRQRQRALALLVRRGYGSDLAYDVVRAHGREAA